MSTLNMHTANAIKSAEEANNLFKEAIQANYDFGMILLNLKDKMPLNEFISFMPTIGIPNEQECIKHMALATKYPDGNIPENIIQSMQETYINELLL